MSARLARIFLFTAGIALLATGGAKIISVSGSARIMDVSDPIFGLSYKAVFWIVGGIESAIGCLCLVFESKALNATLVAWVSTNIIVYRMALLLIDYRKPCPCLGSLTETIHISPITADVILKLLSCYLVIGSYSTLFWLWKRGRFH